VQSSVADAIAYGGARGQGQNLSLTQRVDGLTKRFQTLFVQSDELTKKGCRSRRCTTTSRRACEENVVADGQPQAEPSGPRGASAEWDYKTHADISKLADRLGADRLGLGGFDERMAAFSARSGSKAKMDPIRAR
jgi:hypothetical protein